jgi:ankyrin repeat protein
MSAQALNQLEEEILYVSICQLNADHVQELIASGASPSARINLPSNLRLLHRRYTDDISLENVNKYWTCYLDPEMLLDEVDTDSRDWEYSEEKPEFVITAGMRDPGIARLLIQGRHEEVLNKNDVLVKAVESWLLVADTEEQIDDLEVLRSLLYGYLQKPENKQKINMALVICSGNTAGTQAVRQLLARDADPNCSILDEDYRDASTPHVAACRCGSYDNVKLLLDAQADPNLESESGMIPSVAIFASSNFKGGILDRQRVFELLRQYKPVLMTSSTEALSKPSPLFDRSGYGSRPGSIISAVIMTPLRFHIPLGFLESNGLLAHLDNYLPGDEYGTPLIAAAATGEEDLVNLLLEHGATINAPGHPETEWSHPALAAIFAHNWDLALRLLDEFDVKSITTPGEQRKWSMAFMVSLESDNPDVAFKLIQGGVDINFAVDQEASFFILERAKGSDFDDMVEIRSHLFDMGTPMHAACNGGNPTLIKKLQELEARDEPTPGASSGDSLTAACSSGKVEAIEIFLKYGSDVNECTPGRERWCPLVSALQSYYYSGEDNVVSILLSKGAQANISYPFENSAVDPSSLQTMVLSYGKSLHFSLLWKRMWDDSKITGSTILQAKPFFGNPFIAAAVGRDEDIIELMARQEGLDVNHEEKCGIYPTAMMATLDMKKSYRVSEPLRKLRATEITATQMLNFSHPFRALSSKVVQDNVSLAVDGSFWGNMITLCVNVEMAVPYLLKQGADPNQVISGSFYGSALIAASALLRSDTMMHFLDHGCDINAVVSDSPFGTPLIAVCAGPAHYPFQWSFREEFNLKDPPSWSMVQYDLLELLVSRGADVNMAHNEFTSLIALVLCDCEEKYKIKGLKLLLENGADPDLTLPQWGYNKVSTSSCPSPVLSAVKHL